MPTLQSPKCGAAMPRPGPRIVWLLAMPLWAVIGCADTKGGDTEGGSDAGDDASVAQHGGHVHLDAGASDGSVAPDPGQAGDYVWSLPPGFPQPKVPADNPMSAAKVELGRHLFHDVRLSGNETQSCASCHRQELAFTDGRAVGLGSTGEAHIRGSMSLANVAYASTLTWANPVVRDLERQALVPLFGEDPVELGLVALEDELLQRLDDEPRYGQLFADAFPERDDPVSVAAVTKALAAYQRTILSGGSAYDRYQRGDASALDDAQRRGMELFFSERTECFHCHSGFNFSDSVAHVGKAFDEVAFHNTGLYNLSGSGSYPEGNEGLYEFTGKASDSGRFKAPTLRNVAVTAPYMHDGSIDTLEEVIEHYAAGGRTIAEGPHAGVGALGPYKSEFVVGFAIDAQEKRDLIAFLRGLTDEDLLNDPRFADPWE